MQALSALGGDLSPAEMLKVFSMYHKVHAKHLKWSEDCSCWCLPNNFLKSLQQKNLLNLRFMIKSWAKNSKKGVEAMPSRRTIDQYNNVIVCYNSKTFRFDVLRWDIATKLKSVFRKKERQLG